MSWNGDNRVIMQLELTPDDELVVRNSVNNDELAREAVDFDHRPHRGTGTERVVAVIRRELRSLIVDQDDGASERYT